MQRRHWQAFHTAGPAALVGPVGTAVAASAVVVAAAVVVGDTSDVAVAAPVAVAAVVASASAVGAASSCLDTAAVASEPSRYTSLAAVAVIREGTTHQSEPEVVRTDERE